MSTIVVVAAHPDDESFGTGGFMARHAAAGDHVCLVTCTNGELGEVAPVPDLGTVDEVKARLGEVRVDELREACRILGPIDLRLLGYRDSGMAGTPGNQDPRAFMNQPIAEVAARLAAILREVRPALVIAHDPSGTYGHPDHIQAHRVTVAALAMSGVPARLLYTEPMFGPRHFAVDVGPFLEAKRAALAAHRTQGGAQAPLLEQEGFLYADLDLSWITPELAVGGRLAAPELLGDLGIGAVIDLRREDRDDESLLGRQGIRLLHLPTEDARGVTRADLDAGVAFARAAHARGERVLIHCQYGIGRAPLLACCVLVSRGMRTRTALATVRRARAQAAPNRTQLRALVDWSTRVAREEATS